MSTVTGDGRSLASGATTAAAPVALLVTAAAVCWAVTVERMQGMDMGPGTDLGGLGWFALVWLTMMAAMMLPSLSPMAVSQSRFAGGGPLRSLGGTVAFAAGYLLPWAAFGLLAYAVFDGVASLDLSLLSWSRAGRFLAGGVILAAALYELTPAKDSSLRRCRDHRLLRPRLGRAGALWMGVEQGGFCVGCSGALMAALFALGVMSISWMIVIAGLVTAEKLLPRRLIAVGATAAVLALLGLAILLVPSQVPWLTIPAHAPAAMSMSTSM